MLACARLGAVHSVVFGGFAAARAGLAHRRLPAEAGRSRRRAASSPGAWSSTSRCSTGRWSWPTTRRERCIIAAAPAARGRARARPRRLVGRGDGRRGAGRLRPGRRRPTRSTSSTRRARPACRRASCATTAATPWRSSWSMDAVYDVAARRGLLGGVGHRLGGRPLLHRLRAAAARLHDGPVRGQAGRHAGRGRVLAGVRRPRRATCCSPRRPRSARSSAWTRGARARAPATTCRACARCSSPASAATPTRCTGPSGCWARR